MSKFVNDFLSLPDRELSKNGSGDFSPVHKDPITWNFLYTGLKSLLQKQRFLNKESHIPDFCAQFGGCLQSESAWEI